MNAKALLTGAILLLLTFAGVLLFADVQRLRPMAGAYPWWRVACAVGLASLNYVLRSLRFRRYMARLGTQLGVIESFLLFVGGLLFTVSPGKMGEVFKAWLLRGRRGTDLTDTATAVVAERVTDVLGLLVLVSVGVWHYGTHVELFALLSVGTASCLALIAHPRALPSLIQWFNRRAQGRSTKIDGVLVALERAQQALRTLCAPRELLIAVAIATVGWGLEAYAFRLLLDGLGAGGGLGGAVVVYAAATLFGAASMLPGGVGSTEALFVALCLQPVFAFGVDANGAALVTLLIRFATLWWAVIFGGLCVWLLRRLPTPQGVAPPA